MQVETKSLFYATISVPCCLMARSHSETSGFCFVPARELLSQGRPLGFRAAASPAPAPGWLSQCVWVAENHTEKRRCRRPSQAGMPPSSSGQLAEAMPDLEK